MFLKSLFILVIIIYILDGQAILSFNRISKKCRVFGGSMHIARIIMLWHSQLESYADRLAGVTMKACLMRGSEAVNQ